MANKGTSMVLFILSLTVAGPIGLVAAIFALSWAWEYIKGCFFSLSYVCGQGEIFKTMICGAVALGCFALIKGTWDKSK
jgi:hypothetical protein